MPRKGESDVTQLSAPDAIASASLSGDAHSGLAAFYKDMTAQERRTFWGCWTGWALDGLDFMIYPLVAGTIITTWQVSPGAAGFAVTVTLLASAVGGWFAGGLADRIGRVRTLQLTILWFSFSSLLCAFAQNFEQLLVARALLGFGFGGEWAAGAVLMGETVRAQYRGRAVGSVQSGWAIGWGAAVIAQAILFTVLPPDQAWRWMFALGVLPALFVLYLRRNVREPDVAVQARRRSQETGATHNPLDIFRGRLLKTTVLASLLGMGSQGGYYAITTWLPRFLTTERHLSIVGSTAYLATLIVGSFAGYLVGAWLADRLGRRPLFIIFSLGAIVVVVSYTQLPLPNEILWLLGFPLGFFGSGYFSGMGAFLTELFPTRLRGSGQGFCYNFGRGMGAIFPTIVGAVSSWMPLSTAIAVFASAAYGIFLLAALALPETQGKVLHPDD